MMVRALALFLACVACAHAARDKEPPLPAQTGPLPATGLRGVITLPNHGFEQDLTDGRRCPPQWGCMMHADPSSYTFRLEVPGDAPQGKQVLCIERLRPEPWALAAQGMDAKPFRGARLRLSAMVRIEEGSGLGVKAGPWLLVKGQHFNNDFQELPVPATRGWERFSVEVAVADDSTAIELGVTQQGGGRACFDDVRLEALR